MTEVGEGKSVPVSMDRLIGLFLFRTERLSYLDSSLLELCPNHNLFLTDPTFGEPLRQTKINVFVLVSWRYGASNRQTTVLKARCRRIREFHDGPSQPQIQIPYTPSLPTRTSLTNSILDVPFSDEAKEDLVAYLLEFFVVVRIFGELEKGCRLPSLYCC